MVPVPIAGALGVLAPPFRSALFRRSLRLLSLLPTHECTFSTIDTAFFPFCPHRRLSGVACAGRVLPPLRLFRTVTGPPRTEVFSYRLVKYLHPLLRSPPDRPPSPTSLGAYHRSSRAYCISFAPRITRLAFEFAFSPLSLPQTYRPVLAGSSPTEV